MPSSFVIGQVRDCEIFSEDVFWNTCFAGRDDTPKPGHHAPPVFVLLTLHGLEFKIAF